jgi:glycosyltransferase involved in cell wall biosynthesis
MIVDDLTVLILTYNEAPNIARTLDALRWTKQILIVDSGSTDETLAIAKRYPQVRVVSRAFDTFADQCNFGLSQIATTWALSLDADYVLSDELASEIAVLVPEVHTAGYQAKFIYCIHGRRLSGTLYPARCVLYRRAAAVYRNEGHGHRVAIDGEVLALKGHILHDDRKTLARWIGSQLKYARIEADHLTVSVRSALSRKDRIRRMAWPAPLLVFFYTLLVKRCLFDGWPGWMYVLQRTLAEMLLALEIIDRRLERSDRDGNHERTIGASS